MLVNNEEASLKAFSPETVEACDTGMRDLLQLEETRQREKIILIPSESMCFPAARQVLASVFSNIYAEGYPSLRMLGISEPELLDIEMQLANHRRYQDRRYYKGCAGGDFIEALAILRIRQLFATAQVPAEHIFANVQPLSGAAANNAVYEAFVAPGDTVMGMQLTHGGHLTHGSPVNRSGKRYNIVPYSVNPETGRLDYQAILELAKYHRPKMIIAGSSAYPWEIDWQAFKTIAMEVGAILMTDIAHPAGLIAAGEFPSPVGIADVITFTTHKTLCGPRGAVILTTDPQKARLIDNAVFPGEQGGPHLNNIAAKAVAFKLANTGEFKLLMRKVKATAKALAAGLKSRGLTLAYGGTDSHLLLLDLKPLAPRLALKGEIASRILELCGIVCNKNTIPGDTSSADASAIRLGTVWTSQRGLGEDAMESLAGIIADVLSAIKPFVYLENRGPVFRGKLHFTVLQQAKAAVEQLLQLKPQSRVSSEVRVRGDRALAFLQQCCTADVAVLKPGGSLAALLLSESSQVLDYITISLEAGAYRLRLNNPATSLPWLQALSDGYIEFNSRELYAKIEGPVVIQESVEAQVPEQPEAQDRQYLGKPASEVYEREPGLFALHKCGFIGQPELLCTFPQARQGKDFTYATQSGTPGRTVLYPQHTRLKAKIVDFAGWEMPVWYSSIAEEHNSVRKAAGLFDVAHMGIFKLEGPGTTRWLDLVTSNYVPMLKPGESQYSYLLDPGGSVVDDIMLYRLGAEAYMMVVNAANAAKDWEWLNALNEGGLCFDREFPNLRLEGKVTLTNLKEAGAGEEQRVDMALQGPAAQTLMQRLLQGSGAQAIKYMKRGDFITAVIQGMPFYLSRTGYTGEETGYELYLHPEYAPQLWDIILEAGRDIGIKPAGLGARDSTRTEAGLPLYGHELAGEADITPIEAGYPAFVKFHKPYFIGRTPLLQRTQAMKMEIVRFKLRSKSKVIKPGDPVVNKRGDYLGRVTSAAVVEGVQIGMAYVKLNALKPGSLAEIFILPRTAKELQEVPKHQLQPGDKVMLADEALILPRFKWQEPVIKGEE